MPGIDGLSLLKQVRAGRPDAQVVIMTAHGRMETAVAAMQDGLRLPGQALRSRRGAPARGAGLTTPPPHPRRWTALRSGLKEVWEFGALVGRHHHAGVYKAIGRVAASDVSVLAARRVRHRQGSGGARAAPLQRRAGRPFMGISAAAFRSTLLESELFRPREGLIHRRKERRLGKLELAHGGRCSSTRSATCRPSCRWPMVLLLHPQEAFLVTDN